MKVNTSVKNMGALSLPKINCPVAFPSKDKGGLATHPQRLFGKRENKGK